MVKVFLNYSCMYEQVTNAEAPPLVNAPASYLQTRQFWGNLSSLSRRLWWCGDSCGKGWPLEQKWPLGWTCSPSLSHPPIPPTPAPNKTTCAQILVHRLLQREPKKSRVLSVVLDLMAVKWPFVVAQNFTFLIVSEGDHLFLCVLSMLVSAVVNCLFNTQHIHLLAFVWFR